MTRKSITNHPDSSHLIDSGVSGNAQTGTREIRLCEALRLLVEFIDPLEGEGGNTFEVPRDIPHLKKLAKHGRKALAE